MADGVFNVGKARAYQMTIDDAAKFLVLLLETAEADATLVDYDDIAALLAGTPVEAAFTNYARKVAITCTPTLDDSNDRVDLDIPDQTWSPAGNGTNETMAKLVVAYEVAAADATRIPITHHDLTVTTDGSDLTININAAGFFRAA